MTELRNEQEFIKGMDVSTLAELEKLGAVYYDKEGSERDLLAILQECGVNAIRLRVWNNPFSKMGEPYGAGNNDLDTTVMLARRVKARGMQFLLDIHYSDFWADAKRQMKPKLWEDFREERLERAVYDYTRAVLQECKDNSVFPDMIQIGNEISNGLLWPEGKAPNYGNIAMFVSAGICAVRTMDTRVPIMLHLDDGGNNALYRKWFDNYFENQGEDFQVIGLSYYPFLNGSLDSLERNMDDLALRYGKELVVAEVSAGYTVENCGKQGQADFMRDFMGRVVEVPKGLGRGFFYWEPGWIPVPGSGWATEAALKYRNELGRCGKEWVDQALFDHDGRPLPALETIRKF